MAQSTARLPSSAASTNATLVCPSPVKVLTLCGKNNAAYDVFLVLYDAATAPVPGTTPIRKKMVIPAGQAFVYEWATGLPFYTGFGYAFTKLVADADTTAVAAADVVAFNVDYVA
jgi:phage baseplate assembly protein gpV